VHAQDGNFYHYIFKIIQVQRKGKMNSWKVIKKGNEETRKNTIWYIINQ